jgi:phosphatidylglycerophosphate synthase
MVNKLAYEHECPFDVLVLTFVDTHLDIYYKLGLTPNMITTISIIFGILAAYLIMQDNFFLAGLCILIAYYLDCVDGKLARKYNMITKFGDYYDHFGDAFKFIIVICALFNSSVAINLTHLLFIAILFGLACMVCVHLGYQERIYDNNNKSETSSFSLFKLFTIFDSNPKNTIRYTRYFGCGTLILSFILIIILWDKINGK